jgi:hypothetical protein
VLFRDGFSLIDDGLLKIPRQVALIGDGLRLIRQQPLPVARESSEVGGSYWN